MKRRENLRIFTKGIGEGLTILDSGADFFEDCFEISVDGGADERIERAEHGNAGTDEVGELTVHKPNITTGDTAPSPAGAYPAVF